MKPQFKRLLLLIIALIIIAGGGVFLWQYFNTSKTQSTKETTPTTQVIASSDLISSEVDSVSTEQNTSVSNSTEQISKTEQTSDSYNVTESVDTSGLKPVESQSNNDSDTFTMQGNQSLGNQHNKITIQDGKISITRLNMGTDTLKTNDVKLKTDGSTVTLSWDNQSLSFKTDDKGKDWLETNLQ